MDTSIIVLAAGASARMGTPKPLLRFNGQTCLALVMESCLRSRAQETVLVLGAEADRIVPAASDLARRHLPGRVKTLVNERFEKGQTSTFKTGLEAISGRSDAFVLLPVDLPLVASSDIDMLISRLEARPRGRTIFIAAHENRRGHPVLFSASHRAPLLEMGDEEPINGYIRVREGEVEQVPTENAGVVQELNTPDDYQRVLALYKARGGSPDGPPA